MDLEIIKEVSFEEYNEKFFYTPLRDETEELSRRQFIKYLTIGSAGLLVPMGFSREADANPLLLLSVIVGALKLVYDFGHKDPKVINDNSVNIIVETPVEQDIHCNLNIINGGHRTVKGMLNCKNKHKKSQHAPYRSVKETKGRIEVPKGHAIEMRYHLEDSSREKGYYRFEVKGRKTRKKTDYKRK